MRLARKPEYLSSPEPAFSRAVSLRNEPVRQMRIRVCEQTTSTKGAKWRHEKMKTEHAVPSFQAFPISLIGKPEELLVRGIPARLSFSI